MKASIIVPTYNRPRELRLCLSSLARQSRLPDEVIVADDGSGDETRRTVEEFSLSKECTFPLLHVWQEDDGFRKPRILNESVRRSSGDAIIIIDGDCLAHRHFVRSHVQLSGPDTLLAGRRVMLGKSLSARILEGSKTHSPASMGVLWDSIIGDTRRAEESIRVTTPLLRRLLGREKIGPDGTWGCNISLPRALFYAINGCDEDFLDGSVEDADLGIRVHNRNGRLRSVRGLAVVFHLWHPATWDFKSEKYKFNKRILERRIALGETRCRNGIVREDSQ